MMPAKPDKLNDCMTKIDALSRRFDNYVRIRKDATSLTKEQWDEKLFDLIGDQQYKIIKKKYGEKVAKAANYNWGEGGDENRMSIATKVYVGNGKVLLSEADYPSINIRHNWRDY